MCLQDALIVSVLALGTTVAVIGAYYSSKNLLSRKESQ